MTNNLLRELKSVGLKQNESEVYLFLLQNGISTPPQISKTTNIARTNCYNILKSLVEKDVVDEKLMGKRKAYVARTPESLKLSLTRKIESLDRLLPDLDAIYTTQKNKPSFSFYDGWSEVKNIYNLSLKSSKIYALGSTERLVDIDEKFFREYVTKIQKNSIYFQDLINADTKKSIDIIKTIENKEYNIKILPPEYSKNTTDILIWEENVALISLDEPIFGTVITSKPISDTLKNIFQLIYSKIT